MHRLIHGLYSCSGEDRAKLDFTIAALESEDPFDGQADVHPDLRAALEWHASRSPRQVWHEREKIMTDLETEAAAHWYVLVRRFAGLLV